MTSTIYIGNSNVIEVDDVKNSITGIADEAATFEVTLVDSSGTEVVGQVWPVNIPHVADGLYRATLSPNLVMTPLRNYTAIIAGTGSGPSGEAYLSECAVTAKTRKC
jgi:hypothetical protein